MLWRLWKRNEDREDDKLEEARRVREVKEHELAKTESMWPSIRLMTAVLHSTREENQFSERIMRGARKT